MAYANEILVGRFNNALKKAFGMKGPAPSPQLSGEVAPTISMFYGAEHRFLEQWNRWGLGVTLGAPGAGNVAGLQLRNPTGSNVVAVIEKIGFSGLLADTPKVRVAGITTGDGPTAQSANIQTFDNRFSNANSVLIASSSSGAAGLTQFGNQIWIGTFGANFTADAIVTDIQELTVLPAMVLQAHAGTNNQAGNFFIWWRERFLEESERQ